MNECSVNSSVHFNKDFNLVSHLVNTLWSFKSHFNQFNISQDLNWGFAISLNLVNVLVVIISDNQEKSFMM